MVHREFAILGAIEMMAGVYFSFFVFSVKTT